jgi:6-phosphogluconolactonase
MKHPRSTTAGSTLARSAVLAAVAVLAAAPGIADAHPGADPGPHSAGAVYVLSNQAAGNAVIAYDRADDGTLTSARTYATGGTGTAAGLGSQNAIVVDDHGRHVYAVNAGSDTISSFAVDRDGLRLVSTVPSGGDLPVSVSVRGNLLYALNAGVGNNVAAFRVRDGRLTPIPGSARPLSAEAVGAAEVAISPDGDEVVVTEKATSLINVFRLGWDGTAVATASVASSGATPFGFEFTPSGSLAVSEAGPSALTTYDVRRGVPTAISASVGNNQAAACWVVVTDDGRFAYTGNGGGSQSISGYRVGRRDSLSLLTPDGRTGTAAGGVSDIALSEGSRFLYARLGDGTVGGYAVQRDGSLTALPVAGGLPVGAVGIAAS